MLQCMQHDMIFAGEVFTGNHLHSFRTNKFKSLHPRGGKYEWEEILAFSHPQRILVSKIIV